MSSPPSGHLTLLAFWAAGNVSLAPFSQVICAETAPASQAFNFLGGGARRLQWRTYPLTLALEDNILEDFLITFPWSSASLWVPRVWPSSCPACGRGGVGGRTGPCRASSSSLMWADCEFRGACPPPGGCGRDSFWFGRFVGSVSVFDIMGC